MAPEVGFEPTTKRLTGARSAAELLRNGSSPNILILSAWWLPCKRRAEECRADGYKIQGGSRVLEWRRLVYNRVVERKYIDPGVLAFTASIEQSSTLGAAAWVIFPYDVKQTFGVGNLVPVIVTFDTREKYRGSIAKMGKKPMILLRKDIRAKLGKAKGDTVAVEVRLDTTIRQVNLQADVRAALNQRPEIAAYFKSLAYSHQREYAEWINEAKKPETRERRIAQTVIRLGEICRTNNG